MKRSIYLAALVVTLAAAAFGQVRTKTDPIKIGEIAPDFTLTDQTGKSVNLASLKTPTVLVFYRGYWCPFCARQLSELRALPQPKDKARVFAISIDPADKSSALAKKIASDGRGELPFPLLSDPGHKTIDAYGLFDPAYAGQDFEGIARASILIMDADRRVVWANVSSDYKKRPSVADIRTQLDKLIGN